MTCFLEPLGPFNPLNLFNPFHPFQKRKHHPGRTGVALEGSEPRGSQTGAGGRDVVVDGDAGGLAVETDRAGEVLVDEAMSVDLEALETAEGHLARVHLADLGGVLGLVAVVAARPGGVRQIDAELGLDVVAREDRHAIEVVETGVAVAVDDLELVGLTEVDGTVGLAVIDDFTVLDDERVGLDLGDVVGDGTVVVQVGEVDLGRHVVRAVLGTAVGAATVHGTAVVSAVLQGVVAVDDGIRLRTPATDDGERGEESHADDVGAHDAPPLHPRGGVGSGLFGEERILLYGKVLGPRPIGVCYLANSS